MKNVLWSASYFVVLQKKIAWINFPVAISLLIDRNRWLTLYCLAEPMNYWFLSAHTQQIQRHLAFFALVFMEMCWRLQWRPCATRWIEKKVFFSDELYGFERVWLADRFRLSRIWRVFRRRKIKKWSYYIMQ